MAGVKGMHERLSTSPAYAEKVRARIRAGGIAKRLEGHVLGKIEMTASQVTAALGLLRKVVPDVAHIEHSGEIAHSYAARVPDVAQNNEQWQRQHTPAATLQ
jgi:predicted regulator of amino acid metabolism with ACT domain